MNILVIGRGSIGTKHQAALESLKDTYALTVHTFTPASHGAGYYKELTAALRELAIDAVVICNPTGEHLRTAKACLAHGAHVFLEKPLSDKDDPNAFKKLARLAERKGSTVMVGYDMRFSPWIRKVHELTEQGAIGDIWGARVMAGQYLPEWRPGTDYRTGYGAKKAGGGVLLDLSHELDYLTWLLPKEIRSVSARLLHTGRLEIETEDIASITLEYADRSTAHIHLDYLAVPYRRALELYGEKGTVLWDDTVHTLRLFTKATGAWEDVAVESVPPSEVFASELAHFFDCIKEQKEPVNSLAQSIYVMRIIGKAVRSHANGKAVIF